MAFRQRSQTGAVTGSLFQMHGNKRASPDDVNHPGWLCLFSYYNRASALCCKRSDRIVRVSAPCCRCSGIITGCICLLLSAP